MNCEQSVFQNSRLFGTLGQISRRNRRSALGISVILVSAVLFSALPTTPANADDIMIAVGSNNAIDWFDVSTPTLEHGTIDVTNFPFSTTFNAAAVDGNDNLIVDAESPTDELFHAYAIPLAGLTLTPNGTTNASFIDLGVWPDGSFNAGNFDGRVYYHVNNSTNLYYLNYTISGNTGTMLPPTLVGSLGLGPKYITNGDMAFSPDGSTIWITGNNGNNQNILDSYDATTLANLSVQNGAEFIRGIAFASNGTLYGFSGGDFGTVNLTTGQITTLDVDKALFNNSGDLASLSTGADGLTIPAVPEPTSILLSALSSLVLLAAAICLQKRNRLATIERMVAD